MWPDRVSNPGPPTYESGVLPIALRGPAGSALNAQTGLPDNLNFLWYIISAVILIPTILRKWKIQYLGPAGNQ